MSPSIVPLPASEPAALRPEAAAAPALPGRGRASWSGLLRLSLVTLPVKAYPAAGAAPDLPCHQLHAGCGQRIRHPKHCPAHGPVDAGALVSGYEYAPGQFLVLDGADLDRLRPADDRALSLEHFLDVHALDPVFFSGRSLYLLPDGPAAHLAYAVLVEALHERHKAALGRVVLSHRRQLVLVRPASRLLAVHVLHYPAQLRSRGVLEATLRPAPAGAAEGRLAAALIDAASGPVCWEEYRDDSAEQLAALVEARLQGRTLEATAPEETPVLNLLDALRQSVTALQSPPRTEAASPAHGQRRKKAPRRSA